MNKPYVVVENDEVKFTDLGDGTTEIFFKKENKSLIVPNVEIYRELVRMKYKETGIPVVSYKHLDQ